jgi:phosphoserine phosphatase RsbU/P
MTLYLSGFVGDRQTTWAIGSAAIRLGRSSKNTIQITDATVSKEHAEISIVDGHPHIKDLGSRNGTRVNGAPATEPTPLKSGDRIEIGHVPFTVTDGSSAGPPTRFSDSATLSSSLNIPVNKILAEVESTAHRSTNLVRLLSEAGQMLVLPRSLKETGDEILAIVESAVSSTRSILLMRLDESPELVQVAARYRGGNAREPLVLSKTIVNHVLEECRAVLTTDAAQDPRFLGQHSIVSQAVHSAIAVPLFDNTRVLGILYVDSHDVRTNYGQEELEIMTLLANMAAVKITNVKLLEAEQIRTRMAQELATARSIQRALLPGSPPAVPGYEIEAFLETCYEVGGDLFDFHAAPDGKFYFLVGDVSGKGMGAAMLMSSFMASARVLIENGSEPEEIMTRLNAILHRSTDSGHFVTAFLGRLDPATGSLRYVNAGHNPPYLISGNQVRELDATGVPAGMLPGISGRDTRPLYGRHPGSALHRRILRRGAARLSASGARRPRGSLGNLS